MSLPVFTRGARVLTPHLHRDDFAQAAGTAISSLGRYTRIPSLSTGTLVTGTGGTGCVSSGGAAAYFRDDEYNLGGVACVRFTVPTGATGTILAVGINSSGAFDGFWLAVEYVSGDTFRLARYKYTSGVKGSLIQASTFMVTRDSVTYSLAFGHRGHSHDSAMGFVAYLRSADELSNIAVMYGTAADYSYTSGKTVLYVDSAHVVDFDNGADGWFVMDVRPICIDGDHTRPYVDDDGYCWAVLVVGGIDSTDKLCLVRSTLPNGRPDFADAGRIYDGVTGRCGPIIQTAVQTGGAWPAESPNGWDSADTQAASCLYDSASGTFKMWYCAHNGHDVYYIGYATATPDAQGAPPTTPAGWTKYAGNPLNLDATGVGEIRYFPCVVKRDFTYGGTVYHYQMMYQGGSFGSGDWKGTQNIFLAHSLDGTTWVRRGIVLALPTLYTMDLTSFTYDEDDAVWRLIVDANPTTGDWPSCRPRSYTSPDLTTWTLEDSSVIEPQSGEMVGSLNYARRTDGSLAAYAAGGISGPGLGTYAWDSPATTGLTITPTSRWSQSGTTLTVTAPRLARTTCTATVVSTLGGTLRFTGTHASRFTASLDDVTYAATVEVPAGVTTVYLGVTPEAGDGALSAQVGVWA